MPYRRIWIIAILVFFYSSAWLTKSSADMVLLGTGSKSFLMFPLVTVSLYVTDQNSRRNILDDIPKRLDVHYHVNVPKRILDWQTVNGIKRNYDQQEWEALIPKIDQMNSYYQDIKAGDCIRVTYIPGKGTQVEINGSQKGLVPGPDFAKAFFAIWVGKNPVDHMLKYKLLGSIG